MYAENIQSSQKYSTVMSYYTCPRITFMRAMEDKSPFSRLGFLNKLMYLS